MPTRLVPALLLLAAFAARDSFAQSTGSGDEQVWIDLRAPGDGAVQTLPLAMVEVSGSTGAGRLHFHDVAIVIDLSASTRLRSGVDVNENGVVGKASPEIREDYWGAASPEQLCDDPGDTIAAAEIAAVRRLLKLLHPERTRVALIAFGDRAERVAQLDATRPQVIASLDELDKRHGWYGGTNYASALDAAREALLAVPDDGRAGRKRSILFLSDGYPTLPPPEPNPGRAAIAAARAAGQKEIRIHSFALGPEAVRGRDVLDLVSRVSNGTLTEIERPGEVLFHLPAVELSEVAEVELENQTSHQPGRAIRLLADGSFDGFVPLVPGRNVLRVTAIGVGGGVQSVDRTVLYEPAPGQQKQVEIEVSRLRQLLRDRAVEVELAGEIQRAREQRRLKQRELRIDVEKQAPLPQQQ
ncbi:MAG: VWA domain-containing protein [Myxococcota bacterium]